MNEIQNIVQTIQPAETAGNDPVLDVVGPEKTYQRLAEQIVSLISAGEFKVGERLPSERNLADRFQVVELLCVKP